MNKKMIYIVFGIVWLILLLLFGSQVVYKKASTSSEDIENWSYERIGIRYLHDQGIYGKGIKVGIVDSGISNEHEALNVSGGISFIDNESYLKDKLGHGTLVAGIIGSKENKYFTGIAPDSSLYSIKLISLEKNGSSDDLVKAIKWAIELDIDILNISLVVHKYSKDLEKACQLAYENGMLLLASSGNTGFNTPVAYPAKYSSVIAVAASDYDNSLYGTSNIGPEVKILAPGRYILSTSITGYDHNSGTSFATPHVTGLATLIWSAFPNLNNKDIKNILLASIDKGKSKEYGVINGKTAYKLATKISKEK
jgi:subtilisin